MNYSSISGTMFKSTNEFYSLIESKVGSSQMSSSFKRGSLQHHQPGSGGSLASNPGQSLDMSMQMSPETLQLISHPPPLLGGGGQVLINPYLQHLCSVSIIDGSRFGN